MPNCKSCGAPIVWGETQSGKKMPLDTKMEQRYVFKQDIGYPSGDAIVLVNTYTSHFATCPNAAKHRKKSR